MEYSGMPANWADYYMQGFQAVANACSISVSEKDLFLSVQILRQFNPRIFYREKEYTPDFIFTACLAHWPELPKIALAISSFFDGLELKSFIYPDVIPNLIKFRQAGFYLAVLTDLPTAMPELYFQRDFHELLSFFDFYVSSLSCGYRKPNPYGLIQIASAFHETPKNLIFVGDEDKDQKTAERAGCRFLRIHRAEPVDTAHNTFNSLYLSLCV